MSFSAPDRVRRSAWLVLAGCFCAGVAGARLLWSHLALPYSNPSGIIGPLTAVRFNPANNVVRAAIFVALPQMLLLISYWRNLGGLRDFLLGSALWTRQIEPSGRSRRQRAGLLLLALACALLLSINLWGSAKVKFDQFHDGEALSAGLSWWQGQVPYRDFLFVHGLLQDPGPLVSFWMFGKSIAGLRAVYNLFKAVVVLLLTWSLWQMFRGRLAWVLVGLVLLAGLLGSAVLESEKLPYSPVLLMVRDLPTAVFLSCAVGIARQLEGTRRRISVLASLVFLYTLLPVAAFLVSVDRGFFLSGTMLLSLPVIFVAGWENRTERRMLVGSCCAGAGAGILAVVWALGPGFPAFCRYVFVQTPKYYDLILGEEYRIGSPAFLVSLLLLAAGVFVVALAFLKRLSDRPGDFMGAVREFARGHFLEWTLLLLSLFSFRIALGQADTWHLRLATLPLYLLLLYIGIRYWLEPLAFKLIGRRPLAKLALCGMLLVGGVCAVRIMWGGVMSRWLPMAVSDEELVPERMKLVVRYLKSEMKPGDALFSLDSNASWYYLLDRACPTRFPIAYLAAPPEFQQEIIGRLDTVKVRFILYQHDGPFSRIQHIPHERRLPVLMRYVRSKYKPQKRILDYEIWVRS